MEAQLEHNVVQMSLTGLLIVDILCVVLEMVIDLDATLVAPNPEDAHDVRVPTSSLFGLEDVIKAYDNSGHDAVHAVPKDNLVRLRGGTKRNNGEASTDAAWRDVSDDSCSSP